MHGGGVAASQDPLFFHTFTYSKPLNGRAALFHANTALLSPY